MIVSFSKTSVWIKRKLGKILRAFTSWAILSEFIKLLTPLMIFYVGFMYNKTTQETSIRREKTEIRIKLLENVSKALDSDSTIACEFAQLYIDLAPREDSTDLVFVDGALSLVKKKSDQLSRKATVSSRVSENQEQQVPDEVGLANQIENEIDVQRTFYADEATLKTLPNPLVNKIFGSSWVSDGKIKSDMDFDIFMVDDEASELCEKIRDTLLAAGYGRMNSYVRVRKLPPFINQKPTYSVTENQIRYEDNELEAANLLKAMLEKATSKTFNLKKADMKKTPGYISIFAVSHATPPVQIGQAKVQLVP